MKKWISVLTVLVMLCVTCLSVAAAPSPSKDTIAQSGTVVTNDGEKLSIDNPDDLSKYLQVKDTDELQAEKIQNYLNVAVFKVTMINIKSAEVIIYVPGIKATDTIIVRKYVKDSTTAKAETQSDSVIRTSDSEKKGNSGALLCSNEPVAKAYAKKGVTTYTQMASNAEVNTATAPTTGGKWVDIAAEVVGDNLIKIALTESTFIEVLKLDTSNSNNNTGNNHGNNNSGNTGNGTVTKPGSTAKPGSTTTRPGTTTSTTTSKPAGANTSKKAPKTGEGNALPVACAVFAGCAAGIAVCGMRQRRKTK